MEIIDKLLLLHLVGCLYYGNHDIRNLLRTDATQSGSLLPKLSVPRSRGLGPVDCPETSAIHYVKSQKSADTIYTALESLHSRSGNRPFCFQ